VDKICGGTDWQHLVLFWLTVVNSHSQFQPITC
jgi:hypothetical protein